MKKILLGLLIGLGLTAGIAFAASIASVPQGGTGVGTFPVQRLVVTNPTRATGTLSTLAVGTAGTFLRSSSTAAGLLDWSTPVAAAGGNPTNVQYNTGAGLGGSDNFEWINAANLLLLNGTASITQTSPTSSAVFGNLIQSGGVVAYSTSTNLSSTQFCGLGLAYINSTSLLPTTLKFPDLNQIGGSPCGPNVWASGFAQQFAYNGSTSSPATTVASGSGETLLFAAGSGPTYQPGQVQGAIGQFIASTTIQGATTTGMSFAAYLQTFQPTSTAPTTMGQILSADATGKGWQLTNLVAGSNITIATTTPNQITISASGAATLSGGIQGYATIWTGASSVATGTLLDNNVVAGVNATTSSAQFFIKGNKDIPQLVINANSTQSTSSPIILVRDSSNSELFRISASNNNNFFAGLNAGAFANGNYVTAVGSGAAATAKNVNNITALGYQSLALVTTQQNTGVGAQALTNLVTGTDNVGLGYSAGSTQTTGNTNIFIGNSTAVASTTGNNQLSIGNWLYGFNNGYIGINTSTPNATLSVVGLAGSNSPFIVSSSTGTALLTITPTGSTTIANLTAAACDLKATTSGGIYCGTDATGGSTGNAAWTIGNALIFNATSTDLVGVGTATPVATLSIQGKGGVNPFLISSSTGTSMLTVSQNGSTTIPSLGAGCVNSTSAGALYVATCASGGSGNSAWTIGNALIYNATSTDFVGVGTTTPVAKFVVVGTSGSTTPVFVVSSSTAVSMLSVASNGSTTISSLGAGCVNSTSGGALFVATCPIGNTAWTIGNALIYNATSTDKVGIGTTTPAYTLDVSPKNQTADIFKAASSTALGLYVVNNGQVGVSSAVPGSILSVQGNASSPTASLFAVASSSSRTLFNINSVGQVQIGTTTVQGTAYFLTIIGPSSGDVGELFQTSNSGASAFFAIRGSSTGNASLQFGRPGATDWNLEKSADGNNDLQLFSSGATFQPLTIRQTNGFVGIASATPGFQLSVNGTVGFQGLTSNGNIQISTLCLSASKEVIADSAVCAASAARFKKDINPLQPGLDEVLKLSPVSYYFKPDFNGALQSDPNKSGLQYGLIADDVQKIDPNLTIVTTATSTFENKTYPAGTVQGLQGPNTWIGIFVKAFKDMEKQILSLFDKTSELEKQVATQQQEILNLQAQIDLINSKLK